MSQGIALTGMVLVAAPAGDYDKRVVLLTKERGKITAFARGARRQNSTLLAAASPFSFGTFRLYEGRTAYTMVQADISNYFQELKSDFEGTCYGYYFMEFADYYGRENLDASDMLNLLYATLRALENQKLDNRLVRYIFETRMMVINGEYPQDIVEDTTLLESTRYTISYIIQAPTRKLYTFLVKPEVLNEFARIQDRFRRTYIDHKFKSLEILETMLA
ncbi:MAG: DNA repair protein RecO [Lachnospiraceae bacterium]|nr:DNA repair protein RecO [Lachnospiraceae bacterium]MDD3796590.1 DNA repair protein RecO [Lachnospiraceae bacterium]